MGPRQTMSGFRSSQANERTQGEADLPSRRSRWVSGFSLYQSWVGAIGLYLQSGSKGRVVPAGLVELALRAAHRRRLVVAEEEGEVLAEDLAQLGRHHDLRDRAEREALLRVHELPLVAAVEGALLRLQPLGRFLVGVPLGVLGVYPKEGLALGSISQIVMPTELRKVLGENLAFLLRHYE